jgi:RimJ/RimL family protein N-acetyltransferase
MSTPGEMLQLVGFGEEHIDATWRWLADSEVLRRQIDCREPPTRDGNLALWRARREDASRQDFAIVAEGLHVGNCGLCHIDTFHRKCELWIYLGGGYGRGDGARAMKLLMKRAFDGLSANRLYLRVVSDNPRAAEFYRRLGFVEEGRLREDSRRGESYVDSICFAMLASEYSRRIRVTDRTST